MQVMKINTWLDAGDALKIIELLDALRDALIDAHGEEISALMRESDEPQPRASFDANQRQLPLEATGLD